jgi:hypothetical protein
MLEGREVAAAALPFHLHADLIRRRRSAKHMHASTETDRQGEWLLHADVLLYSHRRMMCLPG